MLKRLRGTRRESAGKDNGEAGKRHPPKDTGAR